ncbi:MAG: hypothetical protein EBU03_04050, partial [Methylophilaceae bacterium]|nr:hypothetical protein [Methylophilaceae bacterium]
MYKVDWFDSVADISTSLWDECFTGPYEGRWWYEALAKAGLEDQFTFKFGLVSQDGKPVAIA